MEPTRVLLVHAVNPFIEAQNRYPALGLGYLISMLKRELGEDVDIRLVEWGVEDEIRDFRPHLFCLSSVSQNFNLAKSHARVAKEAGLPVIIGGYHITEIPENLTQDMDVGVIGEGEYTLVELVKVLRSTGGLPISDLAEIEGIVFWSDGEQVMTQAREVVGKSTKSLDELPMPDRRMMKVRPHSNMLTSRGCPYKCVFCASTRFWPSIRYFSPEAMIEEIKHLRDGFGVRYITFHDDLFIANVKRLEAFHELVLREGLPQQGFRFSCASSATRITDDMARMLKEMNFVSISMGLESGDQEVLTRLKGNAFKVEINEGAVHTLHRHGIHPHASFIIGEPQETVEQMMKTYDFIKRNPISLVNIYVLTPLPGTPVWHDAKARGLVSDDMDWDLLNISFELDWQRVILVSEVVDRRELHRIYQKMKRLRLVKYARAMASHPFQMDLVEYGRAKIVEAAYRLKSRVFGGVH
ncbi:MAG: B12-binding domain-containing radical SAM protein [Thermoanaerobaculales bacterium]|nr:B12-binding domain-containing radical SAM protein [Thermoanaerobaculales bacterium]